MAEVNLLDLFSGIGGFHLGLEQGGFKIKNCYNSEIDKYESAVYKKHFSNSINLGDVRTIKPVSRRIEGNKINIITFGFPCQDLSVAGKREGFRGNRSSLFFEAIRLIEELQPEVFIFENVKGFFSSNGGRDFTIALRTITDIGYNGQWQLINTKWFLPQNRERVYFVGFPRKRSIRGIFPIGETKGIYPPRKRDEVQQVNTLKARDYSSWRGNFLTQINSAKSQGYRVYDTNLACTLASQAGGMGAKTGLYNVDSRVRRLTPIECERLQGFPDNWTVGHSDTQRYKMLGNAVTVSVVKSIATKLNNDNNNN